MEQFLKKFSKVPNEFITDFFKISQEKYNDDVFVINFDIVVKWLNVRKDHLKRLLIDKFEEKYDYTIEQIKVIGKKVGATYKDYILLTPDCFKELCMISQTAKAKEVRKYYLELEKLLKRYYEKIQDDIYKQVGILKNNQKPKIDVKKGVVYIMLALSDKPNLYKIGKTSNIKNRFKTYNSGSADEISPLFFIEVDNITKVENCIKNAVRDNKYRKYKEVYEIDLNIFKQVCYSCDEFVKGITAMIGNKITKDTKYKFKQLRESENKILVSIEK